MLITSINQKTDDDSTQKSQICKSLVIFVGINHLCAVCLLIKIYLKLIYSLENSISK